MRALLFAALTLGSCSLAAPDDAALTGGAARCLPGSVRCGDRCVSRLDPAFGCGACTPCALDHGSALCEGPRCALAACDPGFDDCDGDAANGCESALSAAVSCGRCGRSCSEPNPRCEASLCVPRCRAVELTTREAQLEAPSTGWELGTTTFTFELWLQVHGRFGALTSGPLLGQARGLEINVRIGERDELGLVLTSDEGAIPRRLEHWVGLPGDGAWHHFAFVRERTTVAAWIDGRPAGASTGDDVALATRTSVIVGARGDGGAQPVRLGPTRLSRGARYATAFAPRSFFQVDDATVTQWLSARALDGRLHDEAGEDNDGTFLRDVIATDEAPCPP